MGAPTTEPHREPPPLSPLGDEGAVPPPTRHLSLVDSDIQEDEATMSETQAQESFAPPPHLAARFYRNRAASARRKSSATSSRRNSLSSVHSHASSISHRRGSTGGCQSNYIAQHLRRASIIESRKARLADRAAHAEQVRLRAALAKATPRGSISNSEERALAAQLAKEKYLAKVAATCAEEVARAKRVAEEVKERKLAEETRARLEMEERHAEAERRRSEYQRNMAARRARRALSTEKKLGVLEAIADEDEESKSLSEEDAALRVQRAWRFCLRDRILRTFADMKLRERCSSDTFEDMTAMVAENSTISAATAVLTLLGLQDKEDENAALNSRTFLSAYMIIGHPVTVLNKKGAQEQDLIQKANDLIGNFETCISRLAKWNGYTPHATQLETLSQSYSAYTSAFAAWRLQDSSVLIEGMVAAFVELDAIWQTVKDDNRGEVANDYKAGIRDNQVLLLSRIRKLAGPDRADFLIKKAIRESRKRRPKKRPAAEVRPRGLEATPAASSDQRATLESSAELGVEEDAATSVLDGNDTNLVSLTRLFTPMPSNRTLAHELAIDKDYRLDDKASDLRDQLYRSICESMKRGFEAGDGAAWTVSAAENVREKLLRMLKPGNSMHALISETLDLDLINAQSQKGMFSYTGFFQFMANILPKLCAPYRDAEVKTLADMLDASSNDDPLDIMIEKLFQILRTVDKLSLDYTNFMIMNASATLIREAPGYEQRLFAKDLETGVATLDRTRAWWKASFVQLSADADRRDPEGIRNPADRPSSSTVYAHALLALAIEQGELQPESVPESLLLDLERLRKVRCDAVRITVIGAILLTAKNLLKRDSRSQWKNEAARLWQLLSHESYDTGNDTDEEPSTAQKAFSVLETAHNMPSTTKQLISGTISRFFAQAAAASSAPSHSTSPRFTDPVLKVLFQRLKTHVGVRLSASTSSERVRAASSASEALASSGMPEFTAQVASIVETLEKVRRVDWEAHAQWHLDIFQGFDSVVAVV